MYDRQFLSVLDGFYSFFLFPGGGPANAAVQVFLTDIANIATKAGEKEKPATVIAHLELQEMWKLLHHQAKRVKPAETILVKHPESGKKQNGQLFF